MNPDESTRGSVRRAGGYPFRDPDDEPTRAELSADRQADLRRARELAAELRRLTAELRVVVRGAFGDRP